MKPAALRLLVAALLFAGWLGWLGWLAATKTNPVVVSRSQAMVATHFVVVGDPPFEPDTGLPNRDVIVLEDLRPVGESLAQKTIRVVNIREARVAGQERAFQMRGTYLLMLTKVGEVYELAPSPRAPGNDNPIRPRPWAYYWTPEVESQFNQLVPR